MLILTTTTALAEERMPTQFDNGSDKVKNEPTAKNSRLHPPQTTRDLS